MAIQAQKIIPHLWYDREAKEAAGFYASLFPDSRVTDVTVLPDTPGGDSESVSFELWGQQFMAISAGPVFNFNPLISLMVNFDPLFFEGPEPEQRAVELLDDVWEAFSEGGSELMPLGEYPFSKRYGWVQDRYGLSWQLMLTDPAGEPRPPFIPDLLFVGESSGQAGPAIEFYLSVFRDSRQGTLVRYGAGQEPEREGTIMFADFMLEGFWFAAMDSARRHDFAFSEAVSFIVNCDDQAEVDYYWEALSAVPEAEQCGWLKDRYGISWQIVPSLMGEMMRNGTGEQIARVTQAFLPMKKLDLAALQRAFDGE